LYPEIKKNKRKRLRIKTLLVSLHKLSTKAL
jgi:hypothetical protein